MVPHLGELLKMLCGIIKVAPACAAVVLCVESGGAGFDANNRMIIRVENHIFSPRQAPVYGARPETFVRAFQSL